MISPMCTEEVVSDGGKIYATQTQAHRSKPRGTEERALRL